MCGIVGCVGKLTANHEKMFTDLLVMDSLRGMDSVGIISVNKIDDKMSILKKADNVFDFISSKDYSDTVDYGYHRVLVGHNRAATKGTIVDANAHPFSHDYIHGVHNGTLISQWSLPDSHQFTVDSDNIFYSIMKEGVKETWSNLDGAAALVWWNEKDSTINFLRNKERPLFMCLSENQDALFWASEADMLVSALRRNNIKFKKIKPIETDHHYSISVPARNYTQTFKFEGWKKEKLDPFVPWTNGNRAGWNTIGGSWPYRDNSQNMIGGTNTKSNIALVPKEGDFIDFTLSGKKTINEIYFLTGVMNEVPKYNVLIPFNCFEDRDNFLFDKNGEYNGKVETLSYNYFTNKREVTIEEESVLIYEYDNEKEVTELLIVDHDKNTMNEMEWSKRYHKCSHCKKPLSWDNASKYTYVTRFDALCDVCSNETNNYLDVAIGPF